MGILQKLAIVIRSYFAAAEERIDSTAAGEEAREAESRRRALEEVRSLEGGAPGEVASMRRRPLLSARAESLNADYRFLGLAPGTDLQAVEEAWRRLAARSDPKRFPAGSEEEKRAAQLLNSINEAYERIREALIPTEGRFGQLEL